MDENSNRAELVFRFPFSDSFPIQLWLYFLFSVSRFLFRRWISSRATAAPLPRRHQNHRGLYFLFSVSRFLFRRPKSPRPPPRRTVDRKAQISNFIPGLKFLCYMNYLNTRAPIYVKIQHFVHCVYANHSFLWNCRCIVLCFKLWNGKKWIILCFKLYSVNKVFELLRFISKLLHQYISNYSIWCLLIMQNFWPIYLKLQYLVPFDYALLFSSELGMIFTRLCYGISTKV